MSAETIGRRLLLGGALGALALTTSRAQADTNFTSFAFPAAGAPTARTMPDRLAEIINVKDYGAVGDNRHDDTRSIQAAFDAAFGTSSSPHGDNTHLNRPIYIPAGSYKITSPLVLTNVKGGHIFGDSSLSSHLLWAGPFNGNSVPNADNSVTPGLITNGWAYGRMERFGINMGSPPTSRDVSSAGIYLFGNYSTSPNTFMDMVIGSATTGILAGWMSPNNVSECLYINVVFDHCAQYGLRIVGANTLNHQVILGGANFCGNGGRGGNSAAYSVASGSITFLLGTAFSGNLLDIYDAGVNPIAIVGCRTESTNFAEISSGTIAHLSSCTHTGGLPSGAGDFLKLSGSGSAVVECCYSAYGRITTSTNSGLWLRNSVFVNANPLSGVTCPVYEYETAFGQQTLVSLLPKPSSTLKGVRLYVIDSTVAGSGNFGATVTGGGSNTVPVYCDGASWKIG